MSIDAKIKAMGLVLPNATDPVGSYVATKISNNLLEGSFISLQIVLIAFAPWNISEFLSKIAPLSRSYPFLSKSLNNSGFFLPSKIDIFFILLFNSSNSAK